MKKKLIGVFLFMSLICGSVSAQGLPDRKETLKTLVKVNDYFMKKYADYRTPSYNGIIRPSNIWTRGVYYEGLMALHSIFPREDYYNYAYQWADYHKWGMRNGNITRNADDQCCGQVYIDLYNMSSDPEKIRKIKACIDMIVNTPQVNDWTWVDAIQMGMPIYAKLGKLTGEQKYNDKMWDMYSYSRNVHGKNGLFNPKDGLWWRDADFVPPYKEPNGEDCYWSRGNGWVIAGLVEVLKNLPEEDKKYRPFYLQLYREMCEKLIELQGEDGYWRSSLLNKETFPMPETSGTGLFTYALAYGVNQGHLPKDKYMPAVEKGWNALVKAVNTEGKIGWVQMVADKPGKVEKKSVRGYSVGSLLMTAAELYEFLEKK